MTKKKHEPNWDYIDSGKLEKDLNDYSWIDFFKSSPLITLITVICSLLFIYGMLVAFHIIG